MLSIFQFYKMAELESCSRIEQRLVIKFLVAEQCKPSEIFRRTSDVYEEAYFSQKNVYKWATLFKGRKMFSMKTGQEDLQE